MISYEPLFKTMKEKGVTSYQLFQRGFSPAVYHSIRKGGNIKASTIDNLCTLLDCEISDIMVHIKNESSDE